MAVIGGSVSRFVPLADLYRRALVEAGHPEQPIALHSPGHVAATDELARDQHFPHHQAAFAKIGRERGWGAPMTRADYDAMAAPDGAIFAGSPETVAQKIASAVRTLGLSRFQLKYGVGALPHEHRLESIRLYGEQVVPRVRELLA
jgi:alkanesulfonate monooxygenase SsuD/methylene tetrahydromethanopterin reductase-like flavin-dependent oxidoreductase (luciferase family)